MHLVDFLKIFLKCFEGNKGVNCANGSIWKSFDFLGKYNAFCTVILEDVKDIMFVNKTMPCNTVFPWCETEPLADSSRSFANPGENTLVCTATETRDAFEARKSKIEGYRTVIVDNWTSTTISLAGC